ncbi:MAG: hypothetical protein MI919_18885 [Holophagales bacterium]|nr:hypothetical protein [Holophagales bacterium]
MRPSSPDPAASYPPSNSLLPFVFLSAACLAVATAAAPPLAAQPIDAGLPAPVAGNGPAPSSPCSDGLVRDDGTIESGYGWVPSAIFGVYAQAFLQEELPAPGVERVCVCVLRTREDDSIDFEVVFYEDADGVPALEPFAAVPASTDGVPKGLEGKWVEVVTGGVRLPSEGPVYIGVRWNPSVDQFFFVCDDQSPETPFTDLFFIDDRAEEWDAASTTIDPIFDDHRAALIRPVPRQPTAVEVPLGPRALGALAGFLLLTGLLWLRRGG